MFVGSVFGALRDGNVIPCGTDMDMLIDRKDAVKLEAIARRVILHFVLLGLG